MPGIDEVTIDELRERARVYYLKNGWDGKDRLSAHSVIELMAAFGMLVHRNPPAGCDYPACGCDFDATCNVAFPAAFPRRRAGSEA